MFSHPGILMLKVWAIAFFVLLFLPFTLTSREIYWDGVGVLICFLLAFCLGSITKTYPRKKMLANKGVIDLSFRKADFLLMTLGLISIGVFTIDIIQSGSLSLSVAYESRSDQAQALLHGEMSNSSIWFKIGFLTYPSCFIYIVRELVFKSKLKVSRIILFGALPGILAAVAMGGRSALFNVIAFLFIAYAVRQRLNFTHKQTDFMNKPELSLFSKVLLVIGIVAAVFYAINIFVERANAQGGLDVMFDVVDGLWGVTFSGPGFEVAANIFGFAPLFIIFVVVWYFIQGLIMSSTIMANYDGSMLLGVYGIDLASALARRFEPESTAKNFNYLLDMDTYGFFPSAFGSLYIDFSYGGILITFLWGAFTGMVYGRFRQGVDPRWRLIMPFTIFGIFLSLINTPLGFSNGFVTYVWLFVVFMLIKKSKLNRSHEQA
ncbi:oligosaccharide repeat unit polymerase [Pseudomonadales bacterium]|nr:oligosaccharide repeat unit polymerase [Pseudomonadales bacterium]